MRRSAEPQIEAAGQDSFLDVTTNIVGILIILVMVVGMRVRNAPPPKPEDSTSELSTLERQSAAAEYEARRIDQELTSVEREIAVCSVDRQALATMIAAAEKELADRRARLDSSQQEEFDLQRQLDDSRSKLDRGNAELTALESQRPPTQEVKHYPTPLSRTVLGHEVHFHLQRGRISYVPLDEFIDDVRSEMRSAGMAIMELPNRVNIVGPRNGFEFRYTVELIADRNRGLAGARTREWQVVPIVAQMGEPVDQALGSRSELRQILARHTAADTTVTLWVYPDSFADFHRLKEELHKLGYATAARPLPQGVFIAGSNRGTKSAAQ